MLKKYYKENLKNNKLYISLSSLNDFTNLEIRKSLFNILNLFKFKNLLLKIETNIQNVDDQLSKHTKIIEILKKNKDTLSYLCEVDLNSLPKLFDIFYDLNHSSIELYYIKSEYKNSLINLSNIKDFDCYFYIYLSDNDGPSIIFDKNHYNESNILSEIDKIL